MDSFSTTIKDIAYRGSGVGQTNGKVVFIPHVLQDEEVEAIVTRDHKKYAQGQLVRVITPAAERCEPECEYYEQCPGCCYRHMTYQEELRCKNEQLKNFISRIPDTENVTYEEPVPSPDTDGYRNKITLHIRQQGEQQQIGYISNDNKSLLPISHCPLAAPELNQHVQTLSELPAKARHLTLRYSPASGARSWTDDAPAKLYIREKLPFGEMTVPASSFFQINPALANQMLEHVKTIIQTIIPSSVLDLYCGVGVFALCAASVTSVKIRGIDIDKGAIQSALKNTERLGFTNLRFEAAPAEKALSGYSRTKADRDLWIIDPPRAGLKKQTLDHLLTHQPRSIIYVSCAPDTLSRDLRKLCENKYRIKQTKLFDMFPRTHCFETVILLERR